MWLPSEWIHTPTMWKPSILWQCQWGLAAFSSFSFRIIGSIEAFCHRSQHEQGLLYGWSCDMQCTPPWNLSNPSSEGENKITLIKALGFVMLFWVEIVYGRHPQQECNVTSLPGKFWERLLCLMPVSIWLHWQRVNLIRFSPAHWMDLNLMTSPNPQCFRKCSVANLPQECSAANFLGQSLGEAAMFWCKSQFDCTYSKCF